MVSVCDATLFQDFPTREEMQESGRFKNGIVPTVKNSVFAPNPSENTKLTLESALPCFEKLGIQDPETSGTVLNIPLLGPEFLKPGSSGLASSGVNFGAVEVEKQSQLDATVGQTDSDPRIEISFS